MAATSGQLRLSVLELTGRRLPLASVAVDALEVGDTTGRTRPPEGVGMSGSRVVLA